MKLICLALLLIAAAVKPALIVSAVEPADSDMDDPTTFDLIAPRECEILNKVGLGATDHNQNMFPVSLKSGETLHCVTDGHNGDAELYLVSRPLLATKEFLEKMNSCRFSLSRFSRLVETEFVRVQSHIPAPKPACTVRCCKTRL